MPGCDRGSAAEGAVAGPPERRLPKWLPKLAAAAEAGGASYMDQLLTKLGGGNPAPARWRWPGLVHSNGRGCAGPDSAVGRAEPAGKGFQGAAMAESAKAAQDKKNELFKSILHGAAPQGQHLGHDEVKLMSDGTYSIKGMYGQPQARGHERDQRNSAAPPASTLSAARKFPRCLPWAKQVLG